MKLIEAFKQFLLDQKNPPSPVTVKNYLADIRKFVVWFEEHFSKQFAPQDVTVKTVEAFKASISQGDGSVKSIERYTSSLRKFFRFLKLEGIIATDPFESQNQPQEEDPLHLKSFKNFLYVYNASTLTIKNYLIDIRQFFTWAQTVFDETATTTPLLSLISAAVIEEYKERLLAENIYSPTSINRKLSSLRKYFAWAIEQGIITRNPFEVAQTHNNPLNLEAVLATDISGRILEKEPEQVQIQQRVYSAIPPVRVVQKSLSAFDFLIEKILVTPVAQALNSARLFLWHAQGKPIFTRPSLGIALKPDQKSVRTTANFPKEFYAPLKVSTADFPWYKKAVFHLRFTRPNWYRKYHSYAIAHYFNLAVLFIFSVIVGTALYSALVTGGQKSPSLAAGPASPLRILSFQGRLTDNLDNPITTARNLRFTIYSDSSASGSARLWEEVDNVAPDQDGIFSVLLGSNGSGGNATLCNSGNPPNSPASGPCGIPQSLFAQNAQLWLGVTVESGTELTPRQQLATVAYASNAETLQGLPPTTDSAWASAGTNGNAVLALSSNGVVNIAGSANAVTVLQAASSEIKLTGNITTLATNPGSNGNVQIIPDGSGWIDAQKPIFNSTLNSNLRSGTDNASTSAGAVEVDDLFAVLATSSGQSAVTIDQDGVGPIISASHSGLPVFTVGAFGDTSIAGNTNISGNLILNNSLSGNVASNIVPTQDIQYDLGSNTLMWRNIYAQNIYAPVTGGTNGFWQLNSGALAPANVTNDLLIGSTATSSATFGFINVAHGTPTATISAGTTIGGIYLTATGKLATTNDQNLTLGDAGTGNIVLSPVGGTGTVSVAGSLSVTTFTQQGGVIYQSGANGQLGVNTTGTAGQCLISNGTGAPIWQTCATGANGVNYWTMQNGALNTINNTADLLVGGVSTASAHFSVLGINTNTTVASVSAQNANNSALYLDAANNAIQTVNNQNLTLGGASTGNITISPLGGGTGSTLTVNAFSTLLNGTLTTNKNGATSAQTSIDASGNVLPGNSLGGATLGSAGDLWTSLYVGNVQANNVFLPVTGGTDGFWQLANNVVSPSNTVNDLAVGGNSTASAKFHVYGATGNVTIGTTASPLAALDVRATSATTPVASISGNTSGSTLVVDQTGSGNIFSANQAGATRFSIGPDGTLTTSKYVTGGGLLYTNASGNVQQTLQGTNAQCLFGGSVPFWQSCAVGVNWWNESNGAVYPINSTLDFLIGGNATASAHFGILGVANNSTIASISAQNAAGNALSLDTVAGQIQTANNQSLIIGGASTGNITLSPLGGNTGSTLTVNALSTILNGKLVVNQSGAAAAQTAIDSTGSVLPGTSLGGANLGSPSLYWTNLYTGNVNTNNVFLPVAGGTDGFWQLANNVVSPSNTVNDLAVGGNSTASAKFQVFGATGNATTEGTLTFTNGGGHIQTTSMQPLTLGSTTTGAIELSPNGTTGLTVATSGNVGIGTTNPSAPLQIGLDSSTTPGLLIGAGSNVANFLSVSGGRSLFGYSGTNTVINSGSGHGMDFYTNGTLGTLGSGINAVHINANGFVGIGTTTGGNGQLVVNQTGNSGLGDIFSASSAGQTKFTIGNDGTLTDAAYAHPGILHSSTNGVLSSTTVNLADNVNEVSGILPLSNGGTNNNLTANSGGIVYSDASKLQILPGTATFGQCLISGVNSAPSWAQCASGTAGINYWTNSSGAIYPINNTLDLYVGGTSTASAKFAVLDMNSGTPLASVSAQDGSGKALVLAGDGSIQAVNSQNLTLGGSSTGNIALNPGNGGGQVLVNGGNATLTITGKDLVTSNGAYNLLNTNATTINFAGAASTLNIGNSAGTTNINNNLMVKGAQIDSNQAAVTLLNTPTGTITFGANASAINIGKSGGTITTEGNTTIGTGVSDTLTVNALLGQALIPTAGGTINLGSSANPYNIVYANAFSTPVGNGVEGFWTVSDNTNLYPSNSADDLLVGGTGTGSASFQIFASNFTNGTSVPAGTATSSGNLTFFGSSTNHKINALNGGSFTFQTSTPGQGDTGLTSVFAIANNGNLSFAGNTIDTSSNTLSAFVTPTTLTLGSSATTFNLGGGTGFTQVNNEFRAASNYRLNGYLLTNILPNVGTTLSLGSGTNPFGSIFVNSVSVPTNSFDGYWKMNNGLLSPQYNTNDLAIGGSATNSATNVFQVFANGYTNDGSSLVGTLVPAGSASVSGDLTFRGTSNGGAVNVRLLNANSLNFYTSVGGDNGLGLEQTNGGANPGVALSIINKTSGISSPYVYNNQSYVGIGTSTTYGSLLTVDSQDGIGNIQLEGHSQGDTGGYLGTNSDSLELGGDAVWNSEFSKYLVKSGAAAAISINGQENGGISFLTQSGLTTGSNYGLNPRMVIDYAGKTELGIPGNSYGMLTTQIGNGQLVVNQDNSEGAGDIFSASTSGVAKFTIANDGSLKNDLIPNRNNFYDLGSDPNLGGQEWNTLYVRQIIGPGGASSFTNYWQLSTGGVLAPADINNDLAVGGVATGSAPFQVFANDYIANGGTFIPAGTATTSGNLTFSGAPFNQVNFLNNSSLGFYGSVGGDEGESLTKPSLYLSSTGNVGIGTNNPKATLHVTATNDPRIQVGYTGEVQSLLDSKAGYMRTAFGSNVYFNPTDASWDVTGIGGNDFAAIIHNNTHGLSFYTAPSTGSAGFNMNTSTFNSYEKMRLTEQGTLAIGLTSPLSQAGLDVEKDSGGNSTFIVNQLSKMPNVDLLTASSSGQTEMKLDVGGNFYARKFIDLDNPAGQYFLDPANTGYALVVAGKAGIGVLNPNARLELAQNIQMAYTDGNSPDLISADDTMGTSTYTPIWRVTAQGANEQLGGINTPFGGMGLYENLLTYSEGNFSNTNAWQSYWSYPTTTDNTTDIQAPDGTYTATKAVTAASWPVGSSQGYLQNVSSFPNSGPYTVSVWLRGANGGESVLLGANDTNESGFITLTKTWKRYTYTTDNLTPSTSPRGFQIEFWSNSATYYMWGAQAERRNYAGTYVATTTPPVVPSTPGYNSGFVMNATGSAIFEGNVGIATTSAQATLDLGGRLQLFANGVNNDPTIYGTSATNWTRIGGNDGLALWGNSNTNLSGQIPNIFIATSGNVGIGTTAPGAPLDITTGGTSSEDISIGRWSGGSNYGAIYLNNMFSTSGDYNILSANNDQDLYINRPTGNRIHFRENNADQMVVLSGGNVQFNYNIIPSTISNSGGGTWYLGSAAWGGNSIAASGINSATGLQYTGGSGSQLFTISSNVGQASLQTDGSIFIGDGGIVNPLGINGSSDGYLGVQNSVELGGILNINGGNENANKIDIVNPGGNRSNAEWNENGMIIQSGTSGNWMFMNMGSMNYGGYIQTGQAGIGNSGTYLLLNYKGGRVQGGSSCYNITSASGIAVFCSDYAEYYNSTTLMDAASIVSPDTSTDSARFVTRTTKAYDPGVIGIVSTTPAVIIDDGAFMMGNGNQPIQPTTKPPVASAGRVPVKFINTNGFVHVGDAITSSDFAGFGMKATHAGPIVGKVIQDFDPTQGKMGYSSIPCPANAPTGAVCGEVMVLLNISWYDPDVFITSTGAYNIATASAMATPSANFTVPHYFDITDAAGNAVTRMGTYLELAVGNLRAGGVSAQEVATNALAVLTDNVTVAGQSLHDYVAGVVREIVGNNTATSPLAQNGTIQANVLSPLSPDSSISATLTNNRFAIHADTSSTSAVVAGIDNQGNATFSGTLNSNQLAVNGDATVSGTLHADKIEANSIVGLQAVLSTLSAQNITNVTNIYFATPSSQTATTSGTNPWNTPSSSNSGVLGFSMQPSLGYVNLASYSGFLAYVPKLEAATAQFDQGIISLGPTSLADTSVNGQLSVGANMILADNTLNVLGQDLEIQPLKQGGVDFLAGAVKIDSTGDLTVNGKAVFNKGLYAGVISPLAGGDLTVQLGDSTNPTGNFVVKNASGSGVFAISQVGDIIASGAATISKLNLNPVQQAQAISQTEVVATSSAGTASVYAYQKEITIDTPFVTAKSLIYITPIADTTGSSSQTPFLLRQTPGQSFTVGVNVPTSTDTKFNWLIIN